jgi:preprotein translocase subunit SecB
VSTKKTTESGTSRSPKSLVDKLDLYAIGLDSLSASLDRSGYADAYDDGKPKVTRKIRSAYKVAEYDDEHFDIAATIYLRFAAEGSKDPLLSIDATFTGHFHPKSKLSRDDAERFAEGEARLVFWPYFRQIVSDTTARMHVRPVTLPFTVIG